MHEMRHWQRLPTEVAQQRKHPLAWLQFQSEAVLQQQRGPVWPSSIHGTDFDRARLPLHRDLGCIHMLAALRRRVPLLVPCSAIGLDGSGCLQPAHLGQPALLPGLVVVLQRQVLRLQHDDWLRQPAGWAASTPAMADSTQGQARRRRWRSDLAGWIAHRLPNRSMASTSKANGLSH
jgi:hypothetical protein